MRPLFPLGLIVLLALGLRLSALPARLDVGLQGDEYKYVLNAAPGGDDPDEPADYRNPSLFRHLLALEYRLLDTLRLTAANDPRETLATRLLLARLTVALLGAASVGLLYAVGRRAFGPAIGLLAAALLAVNLLHVHLSHFSLNDVPAAFFLIAALIPTARLITPSPPALPPIPLPMTPTEGGGVPPSRMPPTSVGGPSPPRRAPTSVGVPGQTQTPNIAKCCLLAGLLAGLAAATNYNFGIVLLAPLTACALLAARGAIPLTHALRASAILALAAAVGFLIGMPETLWSFADLRAGIARQIEIGNRPWPGQSPDPIPLLYAQALLQAFGPPALLAALIAPAITLSRWSRAARTLPLSHWRLRRALPLAAAPDSPTGGCAGLSLCPLLYLAYMATNELFFARFALPAIPFLCLLAAYGTIQLLIPIPSRRLRTAATLAAYLLLLAPPVALSLRLAALARQPDTRLQAERWLLAHVPPGMKIAAQSYSLPNWDDAGAPRRAYDLTGFTPLSDPRAFTQLACAGNRYVLTSSFRADRQRTTGRSGAPTGYELLASKGQLVATFRPTTDLATPPPPFNVDDIGLPFWQLPRYDNPGPTINVYALRPEACD